MADTTPVKTAAKTATTISTIVIALTQLPPPYSHWVGDVLMGLGIIGLVGTRIPAPEDGSRWMPAYRVLSYLASNWGEAVNAGMAARGMGKKTQ